MASLVAQPHNPLMHGPEANTMFSHVHDTDLFASEMLQQQQDSLASTFDQVPTSFATHQLGEADMQGFHGNGFQAASDVQPQAPQMSLQFGNQYVPNSGGFAQNDASGAPLNVQVFNSADANNSFAMGQAQYVQNRFAVANQFGTMDQHGQFVPMMNCSQPPIMVPQSQQMYGNVVPNTAPRPTMAVQSMGNAGVHMNQQHVNHPQMLWNSQTINAPNEQGTLHSQLQSLNSLVTKSPASGWSNANFTSAIGQSQEVLRNLYPKPIHSGITEDQTTAEAIARSVMLSAAAQPSPAAAAAESCKNKSSSTEDIVATLHKPKRPLTAYNMFFKEERAKIVEEQNDNQTHTSDGVKRSRRKDPHGKIGFEAMAKTIAQRWKNVDPIRLARYEERAEIGKRQYRRDMIEYHRLRKAALKKQPHSSS